MSQLARRSYRLLTVFRARSVPGNSASQMPAVPFLLVCRSRGCRYSSSYRQGLYPRLFPRRPRPLYSKLFNFEKEGYLNETLT